MPRVLNSTNLRNNYISDEQMPDEVSRSLDGYQGHHLIPDGVIRDFLTRTGIDLTVEEQSFYKSLYDSSWNCLFLPSLNDSLIHRGSHPRYSAWVLEKLSQYNSWAEFVLSSLYLGAWIRQTYNDQIPNIRRTYGQAPISMDQFTEFYLNELFTGNEQQAMDAYTA